MSSIYNLQLGYWVIKNRLSYSDQYHIKEPSCHNVFTNTLIIQLIAVVSKVVKVVAFDIPPVLRELFTLNFPVGSLPNLNVSYHLEVKQKCHIPCRASRHYLVLPTFAGSNFTPWCSEAVIYWDPAQCLYPPRNQTPVSWLKDRNDDH